MSLLDGRVAVVTGGSSGIGRAIAHSFAEHGASGVVVADVREEPKEGGSPTHERIEEETGATSTFVDCDVSDPDNLEAAMTVADDLGGVDVLVNNAGIWRPEEFLDVAEDDYDRMMDVNLKSAYFGTQAAARRMVEGDGGSVINVSSVDGLFGNGSWPTYCASKGGMTVLTYALAHRLADEGIRVNAIHPGGIETMIGGEGAVSEETIADFLESVPLGRYGQPGEVAGAATYLASDLASYVTGESLVVDGGWSSVR